MTGYGNAPPLSFPASEVGISASNANPATVPSPSLSDPLLLPNVEGTLGLTVITPMTPAYILQSPSVSNSIRSAAEIIGCTRLSVCALRQHQSRDNLVHLLSVATLTKIPPLVEAVFGRLL